MLNWVLTVLALALPSITLANPLSLNDSLPEGVSVALKGTFGHGNAISMTLVRLGETLHGEYTYDRNLKRGLSLELKGKVDANQNVSLDEFDPRHSGNSKTGFLKGKFITPLAFIGGRRRTSLDL